MKSKCFEWVVTKTNSTKQHKKLDVFLSKCCLENSRYIIHTIVNKHGDALYNNDNPVGNCDEKIC